MSTLIETRKYKLFANCMVVKGFTRSTICDLQRQSIHFIPNVLYQILTEHNEKSIGDIKSFYNNQYDEHIDEYFSFLIENELIFFTDYPNHFPDIDLEWKSPSAITNAIIDYDESFEHDYKQIIEQLNSLNCKALQLRFFTEVSVEYLENILEYTEISRLKSIYLTVKENDDFTDKYLLDLCSKNQRISSLVIHTSKKNSIKNILKDIGGTTIIYTTQNIDSSIHCGYIHPNNFSININFYSESQKYNTCLNGKMAFDVNGNIKNCPVIDKVHGRINTHNIKQIAESSQFKELGQIPKDMIDVCKDCEFRYVCTDCRGITLNSENPYSKPSGCSYDPYTATWGT